MKSVTVQRMETGYVVVYSTGSDYERGSVEKRYAVTTLEEAVELLRSHMVAPPTRAELDVGVETEFEPATTAYLRKNRAVGSRPPEVEQP